MMLEYLVCVKKTVHACVLLRLMLRQTYVCVCTFNPTDRTKYLHGLEYLSVHTHSSRPSRWLLTRNPYSFQVYVFRESVKQRSQLNTPTYSLVHGKNPYDGGEANFPIQPVLERPVTCRDISRETI